MAKLESSFKNMLIALFAVTFIASGALGLVNEFTKDAIKEANIKKQNDAIAEVIDDFGKVGESYSILPANSKDSVEVFPAFEADGDEAGYAIKSYTTSGFSGLISIMVGFDEENVISGYKVLYHAETPGLGSKMDTWFNDPSKPNQLMDGRKVPAGGLKVTKDGGKIDAITAATISSRAFLDAINRAHEVLTQVDATSSASNKNKQN